MRPLPQNVISEITFFFSVAEPEPGFLALLDPEPEPGLFGLAPAPAPT